MSWLSDGVLLVCFAARKNWALGQPAWQSSKLGDHFASNPSLAVDGNSDPDLHRGSCMHASDQDPAPWWAVDVGQPITVREVYLTNRGDCCGQ